MRKKFDWYLSPSKEETDAIWKKGILTVDTNVLLDLYRYHEDTRNTLIQCLQNFEGVKWLSHQAATEFFRNRTKVIISSEKAFKQAEDDAEKLKMTLDSTVSQLKGNRIIPTALIEELEKGVRPLILSTQSSIAAAKEKYPQFLIDDPILAQLLDLFDGAIGNDFGEDDKANIESEAERRKKEKIPPGYLDEVKDGDRPYGDYFLWLQVVQHAKSKKSPIIFITSERKEDWWEKISGKTTGPRPELLKEAKELSGQRIVIYQTERFLKHALERAQQPANETAIEEIRAINAWRTDFDVAVKLIEQIESESTTTLNPGVLKVELRRPVRNFTVSGHLAPNMGGVPRLNVRLLTAPDSVPENKISAGTGTTHDFNIHLVCAEPGMRLPTGLYLFEYSADCVKQAGEAEIVDET